MPRLDTSTLQVIQFTLETLVIPYIDSSRVLVPFDFATRPMTRGINDERSTHPPDHSTQDVDELSDTIEMLIGCRGTLVPGLVFKTFLSTHRSCLPQIADSQSMPLHVP